MTDRLPGLYRRINAAVPVAFRFTTGDVADVIQGGSDRVFVRAVREGRPFTVLAAGPDDPDFVHFTPIQRFLWDHGLGGPEPFFAAEGDSIVVMEDLGGSTLQRTVSAAPDRTESVYRSVLDFLVRFQQRGTSVADTCPPVSGRRFDYSMMRWETWYFRVWFLEQFCGMDRRLTRVLQDDFHCLADCLAGAEPVLMHRDFQAQNILLTRGKVRIVDFNGARLGPAAYDLASLLYDPYTALPLSVVDELTDYFIYRSGVPDRLAFLREFRLAALQRLCQALGAYGYLTQVKKKDAYRAFMQPALDRLERVLQQTGSFPALIRTLTAARRILNA